MPFTVQPRGDVIIVKVHAGWQVGPTTPPLTPTVILTTRSLSEPGCAAVWKKAPGCSILPGDR
jgi:hypothetical protein